MELIKQLLYIGIGGFFGSAARFLVSRMASNITSSFPLGTMIVNVLGSFMLAFILYSVIQGKDVSPEFRSFSAIGFLGAFTTMSTFSYETVRLFEMYNNYFGVLNVILTVGLCIGAIFAGRSLAIILFGN